MVLEGYQYDQLSEEIWIQNYQDKVAGELTRKDSWERFARSNVVCEKEEIQEEIREKFLKTLGNDGLIPGGRIMSNIGVAGREATTLYNCYVHNPRDIQLKNCDSIDGIYELLKAQAKTLKSEGGYGINASFIRPAGTYIKGIGSRTPGALKFMELWDKSSEIITQGSVKILGKKRKEEKNKIRKGAQMLVLNVWHPEIEDFITAKLTPNRLTKFNLSVGITNGFMESVINNLDWDLKYPDTEFDKYDEEWFGDIEEWEEKGYPVIVYKTVKAAYIWDLIMDSTYKRNDPGVLFLDIVNKMNPLYYAEKVCTTNPCHTKDQYLLTDAGYVKFGDLFNSEKENTVITDNRISYIGEGPEVPENWKINLNSLGTTNRNASKVHLTKKNSDILKLTFQNGQTFRCTPDHHIATDSGMIEAKDLNPNHKILVSVVNEPEFNIRNQIPETKDEISALLMGLVAGDGTFSGSKIHLDFWGEDKERIVKIVSDLIQNLYDNHYSEIIETLDNRWTERKLSSFYISRNEEENKIRISSTWLSHFLNKTYNFNKQNKFKVPEFVLNNSRSKIGMYYLAGMYYADGTVGGKKESGFSVRLNQSNVDFLKQIQLVCHSLGISTSIYKRREEKEQQFKNKTYKCKANYELITIKKAIRRFGDLIGFFGHQKDQKMDNILKEYSEQVDLKVYTKVMSIEDDGIEDVYCLQEPVSRSIIVNTISNRRCGEIPMSTGVCNLGSLNLPMYVKWDEKKNIWFDFEEYAEAVKVGIRYLDNINDISTTPLPEYKEEVLKKRRIGLGNMGWGSLHFMLGIRFASPESLKLIDKISKIKAETELLYSAELGKEKGSFKLFDKEKYFNSLWWKTLNISPDVKKKIEKIGCMRNSHHSMNAPTGNSGIYAKNVSGGIEPVFAREYTRWSIVPEFDKRSLIEEGFDFPDNGKGEWRETKHLKFSQRASEQILKGSFNGKNYEMDKNRGLVVENLVQDYGWKFAKEFYKDKLDEMMKAGVFATAMELSVEDHVNSLIHISHFTNQANSKTVNLPADYPYEAFKDLYLNCWKNNIKGITTYREGTATVVLEVKKDKEDKETVIEFHEHSAPKRPKKLACDIHQVNIKGESWTMFVGKLSDKPYEIFGGLSKFVHIPKKIKTGTLIKDKKRANGSGVYDLIYGDGEDETKISDIVSIFENPTEGAFTRTLSLAMRHGAPIQFICEQLQKDDKDSDMYSFSKVIARVLKHYIKEGLKASDKKCEVCQTEDSIVYIEGCKTCQNCGNSRCG